MPGTTSTALPSFSHDQHHKTDAAKWKGVNIVYGLVHDKSYICLFQCLFEIITSETSYVKSLDIVQLHFMKSLSENRSLVSKQDFNRLFSNMNKIVEAAHV